MAVMTSDKLFRDLRKGKIEKQQSCGSIFAIYAFKSRQQMCSARKHSVFLTIFAPTRFPVLTKFYRGLARAVRTESYL